MIKNRIEQAIESKQGFAIWSYPNENALEILFDEASGNEKFVMFPFDVDREKAYQYQSQNTYKVTESELLEVNYHQIKDQIDTLSDKTNYVNDFHSFVNELKSDSPTSKLVLAHAITKSISVNPFQFFVNLHQQNKKQFVYLFFDGTDTFWTAATPETLVKEENDVVETMALAGTKIPNQTGSLNWTDKEYEEHQLVVDYIVNEFSDLGLSLSYQQEPKTVQAGYVWHLQTPMSCKLNGLNVLHLANHLHPTPAVCGTPKQKAKSFILEHEQMNREYYCGFVGPMSKQKSHLFVNLRCAKLKNSSIKVFVGGGLLKNSDLESEWEETINKSKTILSVL
ncbi:MAG: isochorismate synthase [Flavobacteriales bacterium]